VNGTKITEGGPQRSPAHAFLAFYLFVLLFSCIFLFVYFVYRCSAVNKRCIYILNVDFNSARFDPLGTRSPPYECIKFGYPRQNSRFLLLSTYRASKRLQINTELLLIVTTTADDISGGTNMDDLERPSNWKIAGF